MSPNLTIVVRLEFEVDYNNVASQHVSNGGLPFKKAK